MLRRCACLLVAGVMLGSLGLVACSGSSHGPKIYVDVNARNLYNEPVSGVQEARCNTASDCDVSTPICWTSPDTNLKKGFCRECTSDTSCTLAKKCDHGFCHTPCSTTADCTGITGAYCTGGMCRVPSFSVDVSFTNNGNQNLEIYADKLELHGNADACAFPLSRMAWSTTDATITLAPDASAEWRVRFTPPTVDANTGVGAYRATAIIVSNDKNLPRMPFYFCGEAVEAACSKDFDTCGERIPCTDAEFKGLDALNPDCSSVK